MLWGAQAHGNVAIPAAHLEDTSGTAHNAEMTAHAPSGAAAVLM